MMFALHFALAHGDSFSPDPREESRRGWGGGLQLGRVEPIYCS